MSVIRDNFDYFLDNLSRFEQFIQSRLLSEKDLEPYLKYWIITISESLPEPLKSTLHNYIIFYEYEDVINFFKRFNKEIKPKLKMDEILIEIEQY